jgi:integral membrane protein
VTRATVVGLGYLTRYRILAFTTATLLIVLVFVGIPLQLLAARPGVVDVVGTIHGFLYLVYLVVAFQLARRLSIPKWQMFLVLLAGTVPFCAFIAERKLTRRYKLLLLSVVLRGDVGTGPQRKLEIAEVRRRWFSRRAVLLHLEVLVVAPGCAVAGWWQATRALAGNGLSWFYSVEWPVFAILAIAGWWRLIHEDPEAYRARKAKTPIGHGAADDASDRRRRTRSFDERTARMATTLAAAVGLEFVIGVVTLLLIRPSRPSGLIPSQWPAIYLLHAALGFPIAVRAMVFVIRVRNASRISRLSGWIGVSGVALAGIGGLLTEPQPLRLLGMVVMFLGAIVALFGYLFPTFEKLDESTYDGLLPRAQGDITLGIPSEGLSSGED